MTYQLIALDLDGTLLTDEKDITLPTLNLLVQLQQEGKYIAICTGRSALSVQPLLEHKSFATHLITDNGGTVKELTTDQTLYTNTIPRSFLAAMREVMQEYNVHCDVTTASGVYVETLTEKMAEQYNRYLIKPMAIGDLRQTPEDPLKFTISGEAAVLDKMVPVLKSQYGEELNIVRSGEYFIDIMKEGTTKGKALAMLANHLNVKPKGVVAIGNYYNDLDMLQYAGLGIAMDNSPEDVKAAADVVTLSNNEDGVRLALEKWVLQQDPV